MKIDLEFVKDFLTKSDRITVICHRSPDGDTLGSAFALCAALGKLGKKARVVCPDPIPQKYSYMAEKYHSEEFEESVVLAVDVADPKLLGSLEQEYGERIDLCIDHHPSNKMYAKYTLLDGEAAATAQIIYSVISILNVEIDDNIANCIYTGLSTDTGCFRYPNTQPQTHRIAAEMMEHGAQAAMINRLMFETKSRGRLLIERAVFNDMQFFFDGRCAVVHTSLEDIKKAGVSDDELDGIAAMTRQIEGVEVGVYLRETENGYKVSVRTGDDVDASAVCKNFGGGGHFHAAGCTVKLPLESAVSQITKVISGFLS